jgi:hypothetical protein
VNSKSLQLAEKNFMNQHERLYGHAKGNQIEFVKASDRQHHRACQKGGRQVGYDGHKHIKGSKIHAVMTFKDQIEITRMLAKGIEEIDGLKLLVQPETNIVTFTSDRYDIEEVSKKLWARGYAIPLSPLLPCKTMYLRLYVHPSKERSAAEAILTDLEEIMGTVRAR